MSWKDIIKEEDDFPRYVPRDSSYVTVEEQEQRGQYLFDKKNVGRVYRNKVNGKNYIFNRLYNNGEIELVSQPEEGEYNTMREVYQTAIDQLKAGLPKKREKVKSAFVKDIEEAIKLTQKLMDDFPQDKLDEPIEKETVHRITPVFGLNYDLLPEQ
jgi:glycyl-tRNA synthetase (class II)